MRRLAALLVAATIPLAGCLTDTYRLSRNELNKLAQLPPESRGTQVRVVQELTTSDPPPPATHVTAETQVVIVVAPEVHVGGPDPRRHGHSVPGGGPSGPSPSGPPTKGGGGGLASAKADEAWVWVVIAAGAAVILAATEGARYDGWVQLHPMHPVHLWGPGGYRVVPLAQLDAETAAWAERAAIRETEGPWRTLGRAPLDRAGFNYSVLGGIGTVPSADGSDDIGPAFHIQLGYYPTHAIGILADVGLGWRRNQYRNTIYDSRWGAELHYLPLDAGPFHAGLFGGVGLAGRIEDGVAHGRRTGVALDAGAMFQLELTTRLALTARLGMGRAYSETTQDVTFGLSIY